MSDHVSFTDFELGEVLFLGSGKAWLKEVVKKISDLDIAFTTSEQQSDIISIIGTHTEDKVYVAYGVVSAYCVLKGYDFIVNELFTHILN